MRNTVFDCVAAFLLAFGAMAILFTGPAFAEDKNAVLPVPASGKAIVCIFRTYRLTGSATHDELFVNGIHLAKLLNSEYAFMEVPPGTVVISGAPKMYYAGGVAVSTYTALSNAERKENERARFEAEAGKTYYFKWTSGAFATGIKVEAVDADKGAKEIRKLHPSAPVNDKEEAKPEAKEAEKPPAK